VDCVGSVGWSWDLVMVVWFVISLAIECKLELWHVVVLLFCSGSILLGILLRISGIGVV